MGISRSRQGSHYRGQLANRAPDPEFPVFLPLILPASADGREHGRAEVGWAAEPGGALWRGP